ncbi:MAG: hypothetical protein WCD31_03825 [Gillisia sp.]
MKKTIFFIGLVTLSLNGFSQVFVPEAYGNLITTKPDERINDIEGSPYFEEQYVQGTLLDKEGKTQHAYFRYNVSKDQVEIKVAPQQKQTFVLPRYPRYSYRLDNYTYILEKLTTDKGNSLEGYFMEYYQGAHSRLLGKPDIDVIPGTKAKSGYDKPKPAHINIDQVYYLQLDGGPLHEVRLKEKDFKEYLEEKPGMEKYFDDHKIKDIEDVKKMLEFYDQSVK